MQRLKGAFSHLPAVKVPFRGFRGIILLALLPFCLLTLFTTCKKDGNADGTFTVSFAANGGSGTMANQTFTEGVAQTLTLNTFSHTTLHFNGWATSASGDVVYTDGQSIMVTSNLKLYAKWSSSITTGTPCPGMPTVTDCQGNVYNTVQIGTQCWTKQNLKATKYDTQSERPNVLLTTSTVSIYTPYYTVSTLSHTYAGNLYNWAAAVALTDGQSQANAFATKRQGICPNGWHVPTEAEWTTLSTYLGVESVAGGKMKTEGTMYWNSPNHGATNSSGFSALPAGAAFGSNELYYLGFRAFFLGASTYGSIYAWHRGLFHDDAVFYRIYGLKSTGLSVRCLRD